MRNLPAVHELIIQAGSTVEPVINWYWAKFDDDTIGQQVFADCLAICPDLDHRGYSKAQPDSSNSNLRKGGFRFR